MSEPRTAPLVELQTAELMGRLLLAIVAAPAAPIELDAAVAIRPGRGPAAMVWVVVGEIFDALLSAATARAAAVRIASDPWALAAHPDPAGLGLRFTQAADEADALVAATDPKELHYGEITLQA